MKPSDQIHELMKEYRMTPTSEMDTRVHDDISKMLREIKNTASVAKQPTAWRTVMRKPITKLAAAAAVIVAAAILLSNIPSDGSVVWAEVLANVNRAGAFGYRLKMNLAGMIEGNNGSELNADVRVSSEHGVRIDSYRQGRLDAKMYFSTAEKRTVTVMPKERTQLRMTLTDALFEKIARENGDPRKMVEKFTKYYDSELGRRTINGIEVEGIACHDPIIAEGVLSGAAGRMVGSVVGRLWADTEDFLPVRLEVEILTDSGEKLIDIVACDYQWDIPIEPNEFALRIPDDDSATSVVITADESSALQGLRFFADQTDGSYPSDLSETTVGKELRDALGKKFGGNAPWPDNQQIFYLQMAIRFFTTLAIEDKEPAYHGDIVTAEFPNAVLMRWREGDGLYKVIFGDLSAKQVTADRLAELEAAPLNLEPFPVRPRPGDGTGGIIAEELVLTWIPGAYATKHKVYFGTEPANLPLLAEFSGYPSIMTPTLQKGTTYFWRVDETQPDGSVIAGETWSFDTGSLVAWWKLDDGSGAVAVDSSGNEHHGSLRGGATWAQGIDGAALSFDGQTGYVHVDNDQDFKIGDQITVSAWIKIDGFDRKWQTIVAKGDNSWRLQRNFESPTLEFACSGLSVPGMQWGSLFGTIHAADGQWHHVAGVYDARRIYLYVDGALDASSEASGRIGIDDQPVQIGNNAQVPNRFWRGLIDEVRIHNYALSAGEIAAIFEGSPGDAK